MGWMDWKRLGYKNTSNDYMLTFAKNVEIVLIINEILKHFHSRSLWRKYNYNVKIDVILKFLKITTFEISISESRWTIGYSDFFSKVSFCGMKCVVYPCITLFKLQNCFMKRAVKKGFVIKVIWEGNCEGCSLQTTIPVNKIYFSG